MIVLLATMLAMGLTARLGFWQLDRAQQKLALQDERESRRALPALSAADLPLTIAAAKGQDQRPVRVEGQWWPEATVYLDNRPMGRAVGLWVLTPLRLADGRVLLVQRGWIPRDIRDRTRIAPYETSPGTVGVRGRLSLAPSRLYELGGSDNGRIRQNLDIESFRAELESGFPGSSKALLPYLLVQTEAEAPPPPKMPPLSSASSAQEKVALRRDWPEPAGDVHKHWGYAFQWFGLCTLIAILYVWFQFVQPRRKNSRPAA
jgi:surfeit locus 1 family protein